MATHVTLSPLFSHTVGFDRFNDLFESLMLNNEQPAHDFPPYNIIKHNEENYSIFIQLAGFKKEDLNIQLKNNKLDIQGKSPVISKESDTVLYQGISLKDCKLSFDLTDHMKVNAADFTDGLLQIKLEHKLPEERKPKVIPIGKTKVETLESPESQDTKH